jgi:hypothetical protein
LAKNTVIDIGTDEQHALKVLLDSEVVTEEIRTIEVTNSTAFIARVPGVREVMVVRSTPPVELPVMISSAGFCLFNCARTSSAEASEATAGGVDGEASGLGGATFFMRTAIGCIPGTAFGAG